MVLNSRIAAVCSFSGISDDEDAAGDALPPVVLVIGEGVLPNAEPLFREEGRDLTSICQGESEVASVISLVFISIYNKQQLAINPQESENSADFCGDLWIYGGNGGANE